MFFIGVFGIQAKEEKIETGGRITCPSCDAETKIELVKSYSYFHVFFIPTFKWDIRYYVHTGCCGSVYELDPDIGMQFERGGNPEIRPEDLRRIDRYLPYKTCPDCGAQVDSHYNFCPNCGKKID